MQIHPVVNVSWIKPYHECMEGKTSYQPGLVHMSEDQDNKCQGMDHFVDSCLKNKKLEYVVH